MDFRTILVFLLILSSPAFADVWGKDADLFYPSKETQTAEQPLAGTESIIQFHQRVLSLADGPRSHYYPSSSSYMLLSMKKHGLLQGFFLGCDRLMRENSDRWLYSLYKTKDGDYLKYDPLK
jgi:putative component of membrane protein insertase Oxa1/YidC/SpoIIIJ protein YidD